MKLRCCKCPVERHAYNGCADCSCGVPWTQHVDRDKDMTDTAIIARAHYCCDPCRDEIYTRLEVGALAEAQERVTFCINTHPTARAKDTLARDQRASS